MTAPEMFSQPVATSSGPTVADLVGRLLLFTPTAHEQEVVTVNGTKDALRTSIVVLDGPDAGTEYPDMLVFQGRLIAKLKGKVGTGRVLGRLYRAKATPGQQAPYDLEDFTGADADVARAYIQKNAPAPF